ncbi:MAG TPA: ABC transporter permease [Conexibacter sp.]|jgi:peptide/nickel transport system permease protein|nr:ABC transporter permease [Conexibacter sp.]
MSATTTVETAAASRPARLRSARQTLRPNRSLRAGVLLLASVLVLSLVGVLALDDPNHQVLADAFAKPGARGHLLGADPLGRDVLAWCARGVWTSLEVSLAVATLAAVFGTAVGVVAGYFGGPLDALLMRLVDLSLAIPPLLLFVSLSVVLSPSRVTLILLLALVAWIPYARVVRTRILAERERPYVAAGRLAGTPDRQICIRHLVPAASTAILVLLTLQLGYVLLWEAGLSFLGLGLQPPNVSLGYMVAQGRDYLADAWWVTTIPGLVIVTLMLSFNLIGDGLRDLFQDDVAVGGADGR